MIDILVHAVGKFIDVEEGREDEVLDVLFLQSGRRP